QAVAMTLFFMGEYTAALSKSEQGIALLDATAQRVHALPSSRAPGVAYQAIDALAQWCLGYSERALRRSQQALAQAQALSPYNLAFAQCYAAILHCRRRDAQAVQAYTEALLPLATAKGFPLWVAAGTFYHGWALVMRGESEAGLAQMHEGMGGSLDTGQARQLVLLAEALGHTGEVEVALPLLAKAMNGIEAGGQGDVLAEAYRLKGVFLLKQALPDMAQAE